MLLKKAPTLRHATQADWPAIEALLVSNKLPTEGAQKHLNTYLLAISNGEVVGSAGAEIYGQIALLRSVAVSPGLHKQGIGKLLLDSLLQEARRRNMAKLYILTVTAPEYFARYGFKREKIEDAPQALKASAELQGACPACAIFMSLSLREAPQRNEALPVAVLGAGPVGLAAAAELLERSIPFVILEAGQRVGANLLDYAHVRLFSPWQFNVNAAMAKHLARTGWQAPPAAELPHAGEVVERVLQPFAALPEVASALRLDTKVLAISREGFDKVKTKGRERADFLLQVRHAGRVQELRARAVLDASGTWSQPNPLGVHGLPALGEAAACEQIVHGMPAILGADRARYAGRKVLVVGAGHSAAGNLLALATLAEQEPCTRLAWAVRGTDLIRRFGGGANDGLPARGELGLRLRALVEQGRLELHLGFGIHEIVTGPNGFRLLAADPSKAPIEDIDEIIASTGSRPDLGIGRELRLRLDPWLESTDALAPLIDPNLHSCGTVRPHGHRELAHPEPGFYAIGAKSYGRAPNFLMATGYEQARSVVAALAGDLIAADDVQLELPETGVCSANLASPDLTEGSGACCGGPAKVDATACCSLDETSKAQGDASCGCGPSAALPAVGQTVEVARPLEVPAVTEASCCR